MKVNSLYIFKNKTRHVNFLSNFFELTVQKLPISRLRAKCNLKSCVLGIVSGKNFATESFESPSHTIIFEMIENQMYWLNLNKLYWQISVWSTVS